MTQQGAIELGSKIYVIHNKLGLSRVKLAEFCDINIRTMERIEKGINVHQKTYHKVMSTLVKHDFVPLKETVECVRWLYKDCIGYDSEKDIKGQEVYGIGLKTWVLNLRGYHKAHYGESYRLMAELYCRPLMRKNISKKKLREREELLEAERIREEEYIKNTDDNGYPIADAQAGK